MLLLIRENLFFLTFYLLMLTPFCCDMVYNVYYPVLGIASCKMPRLFCYRLILCNCCCMHSPLLP